jgi:uncharacterized repeat protein (TIGR03803 family)
MKDNPMQDKKLSRVMTPATRFSPAGFSQSMKAAIVVAAITLALTTGAWADRETVLHAFGGTSGGTGPTALIVDTAGNLYGVLSGGGNSNCRQLGGCGAIFKLTKNSSGQWIKTTVHLFTGGSDGASPTGIVMDAKGNIFGVAEAGGNTTCLEGCGVIFEISPTSSGGMKETALYSFQNSGDGLAPNGSLIADAAGNLYGVASGGANFGVVFELSPSSGGKWTETTLHSFSYSDGNGPRGPLVFDAAGNLFGVTAGGGSKSNGTVFELSPLSGGGWSETVIHDFMGWPSDGIQPMGGLFMDANGNLYGTTAFGGPYAGPNGDCLNHCGTVFELSRNSGGWTETVLGLARPYTGSLPLAGLIMDSAGNLYGTTAVGGHNDKGLVFKLSPNSGGGWTDMVLFAFKNYRDGGSPQGTLVMDSAGNLFGTATTGGSPVHNGVASGNGVVFELSPSHSAK